MRVQKVLVATDLSPAGDGAVRTAAEWAARFQAQLFVCHVLPNPLQSTPLLPHLNQQKAEQLPQTLELAERRLRERVRGLTGRTDDTYTAIVTDGPAHVGIIDEAEQAGADLVVVGSLGHSSVGRLLLGSVAELVVRAAHCPVLVARPAPNSHRVLVATDFSEPSAEAVRAGAEVCRRFSSQLTLMHALDIEVPLAAQAGILAGGPSWVLPPEAVQELRQELERRLSETLQQSEVGGDRVLVEGRAAAEILRLAEKLEPSLLVVGTTGRSGLRRLVMGSVAERVVRSAPCSVLVVRAPQPSRT